MGEHCKLGIFNNWWYDGGLIMNEINIRCSLESPQDKQKDILLTVEGAEEENLLYKFLIGRDGTWKTLRDFQSNNNLLWCPEEDGKYIIMVQAKKQDSRSGFDYVSKIEYIIGEDKERLINGLYINKEDVNLGDKITITVEGTKIPLMYRYWIREEDKWELIKEYSPENMLNWTVLKPGIQQVLVECKNLDSDNSCDDFQTVSFKVRDIRKLEITDFKCLTKNLLKGKEILFQVNASYEDSRMILYKFVKIYSDGNVKCIQDYSTKRTVSYTENEGGEFKLLCLAKDMYSTKEFDDRAIILYKVKQYEKIKIQAFTTDLSSPQICGTDIELKAIVKGGENLLYRFNIKGPENRDSGYIESNKYIWKPEEIGNYTVVLYVKDETFEGEYESKESLEFNIDEISAEDVKIEDVIYEKRNAYLKKQVINVQIEASGGIELKYSFIVRKGAKEVEKVNYGSCNWVNFTPEECGIYELEVRVKDKYSRREYDTHEIINMEVKDYLPANIDYVLTDPREFYMVGDEIRLEVICPETQDTMVKYILKINGHPVEETDYIYSKLYKMLPRCKGIYQLDIYAKNIKSTEEYDSKKSIRVCVNDCFPVTDTKLKSNKLCFNINECVTFSVSSEGGKDVVYEFYLMEKGEWKRVQRYNRKEYYSFIPFSQGIYKILVLSKSRYKKQAYEDYDSFQFLVEEPKGQHKMEKNDEVDVYV